MLWWNRKEPAASGKEANMHTKDYETLLEMVKISHVNPQKERELHFFMDTMNLAPSERQEITARILQKFSGV